MNTPKQHYGHIPPNLGGERMGEWREGDLFWNNDQKKWQDCQYSFHPLHFYTRPIDVGEGYELVGEDEKIPKDCDVTLDGIFWYHYKVFGRETVKSYISRTNSIAIRCKKVQQPVQSEWPKYFESALGGLWRADSQNDSGHYWQDEKWKYSSLVKTPVVKCGFKPITPEKAKEIMEPKTKYGKGTKVCPTCGMFNNPFCSTCCDMPKTIESGEKKMCKHIVYYYSKEHDNFYCLTCNEGLGQEFYNSHISKYNKKPNWLSIEQCDLKPGEAFHALHHEGFVAAFRKDYFKSCDSCGNIKERLNNAGYTHFIRALPPYAVPDAPVKVEPVAFPLIEGKPIVDWLNIQFPTTKGNVNLEQWALQLSDFYNKAIKKGEVEI